MKNNVGFSLIELMIALVISTMIITGLFSTLYQVGLAENTITSVTDAHQKASILFTHLERDIMGAFIPEQADPIKKPKDAHDKQETAAKPVDKIFWGKSRDDKNLELFTCITSNPLEVYLGAKNTKPKTRIARIVYRLEPQKGVKDSFILMRQEGADVFFDSYKKTAGKNKTPAGYEMIEGIASLSISYLAPDTKNEKKEGQEEKKKYEKTKNWNSEVKQEKTGQIQYKLPEFVEIELFLWDTRHEKKFEFTYTIPIMFQKDRPKRKQDTAPAFALPQPMLQPTAQPMAVARSKKMGPPSISTHDGKKITISKDERGDFVVQEVPA